MSVQQHVVSHIPASVLPAACGRLLANTILGYIRWSPLNYKKGGLYERVAEPQIVSHLEPTVAQARFGAWFHVHAADVIQRHIYSFGVWEPAITDFVKRRLEPGDTFIDVGANIGYYTLLASSLVGPTGSVVAVEASPSIYAALQDNLHLNGVTNVRPVHVAASDASGLVDIYLADPTNIGETTLLASRGFRQEAQIRCEPLTSILTEREVRSARVIKIDVEGHELPVMTGLMPILTETRSDLEILMEANVDELEAQGSSVAELVERWERAGFHAYMFDNRYSPGLYACHGHRLGAQRLTSLPGPGVVADLVLSRADLDVLL
jgi:FkbM family methyltransferase